MTQTGIHNRYNSVHTQTPAIFTDPLRLQVRTTIETSPEQQMRQCLTPARCCSIKAETDLSSPSHFSTPTNIRPDDSHTTYYNPKNPQQPFRSFFNFSKSLVLSSSI